MSEYSLSALRVGQSAYVAEIQADEAMRRRLLDLGLIRGAVIALRGRDARGVRLEGLCPERAPAGRTALA